jgi:hypothetical protein
MALLWSAATSLPYDTMARCNWFGVMVLSPLTKLAGRRTATDARSSAGRLRGFWTVGFCVHEESDATAFWPFRQRVTGVPVLGRMLREQFLGRRKEGRS